MTRNLPASWTDEVPEVMQELAASSVAMFAHVEVDEEGSERVIERAPRAAHVPRLRILAAFGDTIEDRARVFAEHPVCVQCDLSIESADDGGLVPTEQGLRLAHRRTCFGPAMVKHHPQLAITAAIGRASRARCAAFLHDEVKA